MNQIVSHTFIKRVAVGALYVFGPLFLVFTDPVRLPLPLLVVPFIWLFVVIFVTTVLIAKRREYSGRRVVMLAGVLASLPVLLLIFQSIHQLTVRDVLLALALVLVTAFYLHRADFIR